MTQPALTADQYQSENVKKTLKNIGNSILASGEDRIYKKIKAPNGHYYLECREDDDTHALIYVRDGNTVKVELCTHPNGYSCYVLAIRLMKYIEILSQNKNIEQIKQNVINQAKYICDCGGTSDIENIFKSTKQ